MRLPFKKDKDQSKPLTLQDLQQQFNQTMFELGDLNYRKHMIKAELTKLESEINTRTQRADKMGADAAKLREKMQAEVKAKAEKGKKDVKEA